MTSDDAQTFILVPLDALSNEMKKGVNAIVGCVPQEGSDSSVWDKDTPTLLRTCRTKEHGVVAAECLKETPSENPTGIQRQI